MVANRKPLPLDFAQFLGKLSNLRLTFFDGEAYDHPRSAVVGSRPPQRCPTRADTSRRDFWYIIGLAHVSEMASARPARCSMVDDPLELRCVEDSEASGDVRKTCLDFGIGRASFYRWRQALRTRGEAGLANKR